jgi:hypothetical protein
MTPVNGEFDDRLRRALHAEVETVELAADGLERILRRAREPWLLRQLSLMFTECADLFWLIVVRLEPGASKLRQAIAAWTSLLAARTGLLVARTGLRAAPAGRRHAGPGRRARPGSRLGWLRPALAVSAAVIVVAAGVYGLAQLRQSLVLDLFPNAGIPATTGPAAPHHGQSGGSVQGHTSPGGLLPASGPASATPTASATCPPVTRPTPTPTPSPTPTPTPTPTPSVSPTPTPTVTATTTAFIATRSDISLAGRCTQSGSKSARTS